VTDNVNQPLLYPRPSPKDYAIPGDYFRAVQEWEHAQAVTERSATGKRTSRKSFKQSTVTDTSAYFRAVQEWEHAQAVCGLRPLEPLPPDDKVRRFSDTELGRGIGSALIILALCLGIGGCLRLLI
jgi:hypothetical protein